MTDEQVTVILDEASTVTVIEEDMTVALTEETVEVVSILEGPKGDKGEDGDSHYSQDFTFATSVHVEHNLGKRPAVTIIDSAGDEVVVDVTHHSPMTSL